MTCEGICKVCDFIDLTAIVTGDKTLSPSSQHAGRKCNAGSRNFFGAHGGKGREVIGRCDVAVCRSLINRAAFINYEGKWLPAFTAEKWDQGNDCRASETCNWSL